MFDVPDFMHVEGTYTTNMVTKAYSSISDYTRAISQYSNTKKGDTSFKDETTERFRKINFKILSFKLIKNWFKISFFSDYFQQDIFFTKLCYQHLKVQVKLKFNIDYII